MATQQRDDLALVVHPAHLERVARDPSSEVNKFVFSTVPTKKHRGALIQFALSYNQPANSPASFMVTAFMPAPG